MKTWSVINILAYFGESQMWRQTFKEILVLSIAAEFRDVKRSRDGLVLFSLSQAQFFYFPVYSNIYFLSTYKVEG